MSDPQNLGLGELGQRVQALSDPAVAPRLRPYKGVPLPVGPASNGRPIPSYESFEEFRVTPVTSAAAASKPPIADPAPPAPSHPLEPHAGWEEIAAPPAAEAAPALPPAPSPNSLSDPTDPNAPKSGLQRAINAVRAALPIVQRLLPLLDGNFATTLSALVAPQQHHPPPPPVDLDPLERGLAEVRNSHRELRGQVQEQVATLKRVEDQLERVREATDRNTLEQQELVEDLRSMGSRIFTFIIVGLLLLAGSIGLNIFFLVQLQHILH